MARARNIKPGFFANEHLGQCDPLTSLLFIGLWTLADREGRLEDRPSRIRALVFPYRMTADVDGMLGWLNEHGFIVRYEVNGRRFLQIENFAKHQQPHYKEVASDIPPPRGRKNSPTTPGAPSTETRERVFNRDGRRCQKCGTTERLSLDHVVPRSRGGPHTDDNLWTLCVHCNSEKSKRQPRSDEGPTNGQCRVKVDSTSADDESTKAPHDPLIPDSLIPDSLQSDSPIPLTESPIRIPPTLPLGPDGFDTFWQAWPKKVARSAAMRAWKKLRPSPELQATILADVAERADSEDWTKESRRYMPHASSYLAGHRWEDERPTGRHHFADKVAANAAEFVNAGGNHDPR